MNKPLLHVIQSVATPQLHQEVWAAVQSAGWLFGHGSNAGQAAVPFWKMELEKCAPVTQLWEQAQPYCEKQAGRALRVVRQYANGHTYGQGGQPHRDDVREGTYTLLYYPMPQWKPEWEGETMFVDGNGEVLAAFKPHPNRGIFFDSRILHYGKAPGRSFPGLRVTVAFKLESV